MLKRANNIMGNTISFKQHRLSSTCNLGNIKAESKVFTNYFEIKAHPFSMLMAGTTRSQAAKMTTFAWTTAAISRVYTTQLP